MAPYLYKKLDESTKETRIVILPPGSFNDEIHVSLETISLGSHNDAEVPGSSFEALSYTWGALTNPVLLNVLDDRCSTSTISIMQNLATALPYLRLKDRERRLWIDAICINQQDLNERSSQVKLMSAIYRQAEVVTLWLGLADADTEKAYKLLASLGTRITVDWPTKRMDPVSQEHAALADKAAPLQLGSEDYHALYSVLKRSWFDRLWIRQEVLLARKAVLTCGNLNMSWTTFRNAIYCIFSKPSPGSELLRLREGLEDSYTIPLSDERLQLVLDLVDYGGAYEDLGHRIYRARYSNCMDPRNRIYAMVSLLYDDEEWDFEPDYTMSQSQAYEEATYSYMEAAGDLGLLSYCRIANPSSAAKLPTWVPQWDHLQTVPAAFSTGNADCISWPCYRREKRHGHSVLYVNGINLECVKDVSEYIPIGNPLEDAIEELRRLLRQGIKWLGKDDDGVRVALNRTISGRNHRDLWDPPNLGRLTELEELSALDKLLDSTILGSHFEDDSQVRQFARAAIADCRHRALFVTNSRTLGLGPSSMRSGDHITVLFGARKPMILRSVDEGGNAFQLVGECHVDSLIAGQTFLGPLPDHWEWINKKADEGYYRDMYRDAYRDNGSGTTQWDDPRWAWILGEDYPDKGCLETMDEKEQNQSRMDAVVKIRKLECTSFCLV